MRSISTCLWALALFPWLAGPARAQEPTPRNPLARSTPDPWSGQWTGDGLSMRLARQGQGWTGELVLGEQRFPLEARAAGDGLTGSFQSGADRFPFSVARAPDGSAVLESGGSRYTLRGGPSAGAPGQPVAPRPGGVPVPARTNWQTFRHPLGPEVGYPPGWSVQEIEGGVALVPPDAALHQGQPVEAYLVFGLETGGITRPDDPRALEWVRGQIQAMFPFLTPQGEAAPVAGAAQPLVLLGFSGRNPLGLTIRARVYVTICKDVALVLLAVGQEGKLREELAQGMALSLGVGQAQLEPALVGSWRHESHYFSGSFSSTTLTYLQLRPDGTATSGGRLLASMEHRDSGGDATGWSNADTGDPDTTRGRWSAAQGRLVLSWQNGNGASYTYELSGNSLLLKPTDGGKPKLYERVN